MSRVHMRCRHCDARRVISKPIEQYVRLPACNVCGKRQIDRKGLLVPALRPDGWMNRRNTRAMGCMCSGYSWAGNMSGAMHRKGSLRCYFRADGSTRQFGDPDYFIDPDQERFDFEAMV